MSDAHDDTSTGPIATVTEPAAGASPATPPGRRRLKRSTRIALIVILIVAVLAAAALVATYLLDTSRYVSTDNAQIDGDKIVISAPVGGTLIDWSANQGTTVRANQVVGRIRIQGGFVQPEMSIRAPADGTVVVDSGVEGAFAAAGTPLATEYDLSKVFVTARVDETDIDAVHAGQQVDFTVDAFPGASLHGTVVEIQGGAAGQFSLFPQANTSGNFQKVTQVIPVKIVIADQQSLALVPGMNVTVKIHKS